METDLQTTNTENNNISLKTSNIWTFLQHSNEETEAARTWADSFVEIGRIESAEELNGALAQIKQATLKNLNIIYFFRENIKPMWEDKVNVHGGRVIIEISLSNQKIQEFVDRSFMFAFLNAFPTILGVAYNEKENNARISLWIGDGDADEQKEIAAAWKEVLNTKFLNVNFVPHNRNKDRGMGRQQKRNNSINILSNKMFDKRR